MCQSWLVCEYVLFFMLTFILWDEDWQGSLNKTLCHIHETPTQLDGAYMSQLAQKKAISNLQITDLWHPTLYMCWSGLCDSFPCIFMHAYGLPEWSSSHLSGLSHAKAVRSLFIIRPTKRSFLKAYWVLHFLCGLGVNVCGCVCVGCVYVCVFVCVGGVVPFIKYCVVLSISDQTPHQTELWYTKDLLMFILSSCFCPWSSHTLKYLDSYSTQQS